jgi:hypothetical protein
MTIKRKLAVVASLAALSGCRTVPAVTPKAQVADDRAEILIRHLQRQIDDSDKEIGRLRTEMLKRDNQWLQASIDSLEGRPSHGPPQLRQALPPGLSNALNSMAQHSLDAEEMIELHNRNHPEAPYEGLLQELCGDCTRERQLRNQQLKEEALGGAAK